MTYTEVSGQIQMHMEEILPLEGEKSFDKLESKKSRLKIEAREHPPRGSLRQSHSTIKAFQNHESVSGNSTLAKNKKEPPISQLKSLYSASSSEKNNFASENKIRNLFSKADYCINLVGILYEQSFLYLLVRSLTVSDFR